MNVLSKVYIETTIPSLLTAFPSMNILTASKQEITRLWWEERREQFELFVSELVVEEAMKGDVGAAQRRIQITEGLPLLEIDEETIRLTDMILHTNVIPPKAAADAAHIALASRHAMDYLLTWNCKHIANAEIIRRISYVVVKAGFLLPVVCTPMELSGGQYDV